MRVVGATLCDYNCESEWPTSQRALGDVGTGFIHEPYNVGEFQHCGNKMQALEAAFSKAWQKITLIC